MPNEKDGTALEDDGEIVFDGTLNHPTIEGPKLYKKTAIIISLLRREG
ncbi:hypothetical protein PO124_17120 [Bacillus licheniformis]|nr:hypothetical protein [Bacillus licheniformis]